MLSKKMPRAEKINILLVIPKQNIIEDEDYAYIFPLGLAYISAILKKTGYSVDCLNLNHYKGKVQDLINNQLDRKRYDFVCTGSIITGFSCVKLIINTAKSHKSKPKVILGGLIITSEPEIVFKLLEPDYAVIGEGEKTVIELIDFLKKGKDLRKVRGIEFRDESGKLVITEKREPIKNIDKIPFPDYEGLEFEKYVENQHPNLHDYLYSAFDHPKAYTILASKGCPFNCTFCYHYATYRKRSIKNIMKELKERALKYKINAVLFYDECIAVDKERLYDLCRKMKKFREGLPWELKWYVQLTIHNISDETLKTMKDSGVAGVSYGFESLSPIVLKSMNKPITPEMISSTFHKTLKAGLTVQANFIFGDIAETKETAKETLEWWKKNANGQIWLLFVQPYPGSRLYHYCLEKGIIKDREKFIKNVVSFSKFNMTKKMSDKEMEDLRTEILDATRKYCKFLRPIKMKKVKKNIYNIEVKCPYCSKIVKFGNCLIKNKWSFRFNLPCRECGMRFYTVGPLSKLGYSYYPYTRRFVDYYKILKGKINDLKAGKHVE